MSVRKTPCIVQDISSVPVELDIWLCSKICFRTLKRRRDELRQLDIEKGMCIPTSLAVQVIRGGVQSEQNTSGAVGGWY